MEQKDEFIESEYYKSEKFIKKFKEQIIKDTWDKGLPMCYGNDKGEIVKHYRNGKIEIIGYYNNTRK